MRCRLGRGCIAGYFRLSYAAYHTLFTIPVAVGLALSQPKPLSVRDPATVDGTALELSNGEVAKILGLAPTAASNRYVRALRRLKGLATGVPGLGGPDSD